MTRPNWLQPAAPLTALTDTLGIPRSLLQESERQTDLRYNDTAFPADRASTLTLDTVLPIVNAYGEALTCRFLVGDFPALTLDSNLRQLDLDSFRQSLAGQTQVELDLRLDKTRLLRDWAGTPDHTALTLFLFPGALVRALNVLLPDLERSLFADADGSRKIVVLVPEADIALDGEYLAVVGGAAMSRWQTYLPQAPPNAARVAEMYGEAIKHVKWVYFGLQKLTPLHLMVMGQAQPDDPIALELFRQLVALSIVYTADQTKAAASGWIATYAAQSYVAEVAIGDREALSVALRENTRVDNPWVLPQTLASLAAWTYQGERGGADRLSVMQGVIAHTLQGNDARINYREMVRLAGHLQQEVEWGWAAFIEDKLNVYFSRLRDLEAAVDATVKSFDEQSQAVIKSLSDSVLAAVGVVIGSFIGALFKDNFNPLIFRLGVILYAVYVLIFPAGMGLLGAWQRFGNAVVNFNKRKQEFAKRLFPEKVEQIVGTTVDDAARHFKGWFVGTLFAYVVVIAFLLVAAAIVPNLVPLATATPTPTSTPLATVTPIGTP